MWGATRVYDITKKKILLYSAKKNNQFKVSIYRAAPTFDTETSMKITETLQEVSIVHDGMETQTSQTGNAILTTYGTKQAGEITITFLETDLLDVFNFLTLDASGKQIIPSDGTSLLPLDFYFHIEVTHKSKDMQETLLGSAIDFIMNGNDVVKSVTGDYLLSGNITHAYKVGEPEFQTIQAQFKKIKTWGI